MNLYALARAWAMWSQIGDEDVERDPTPPPWARRRYLDAETRRTPGAAVDRQTADLAAPASEWVNDRIARAARRALGLDA